MRWELWDSKTHQLNHLGFLVLSLNLAVHILYMTLRVNPHQADVSESLIYPTKEIGYIGYIFAFYATKMGSRDSGDTKVDPLWV